MKLKIVLAVTLVLLGLDQASKIWVVRTLAPGTDELHVIPGFLSFVHAQNPGAAMGLFTSFEYRLPLFLGFTAVALWVLWSMYRELPDDSRLMSTTVACILAGAVGNLIDRVHKQTVTDFIRVYSDWPPIRDPLVRIFRTNEWPTFNIADSAIVIGVALYLLHYVLYEVRPKAAGARTP